MAETTEDQWTWIPPEEAPFDTVLTCEWSTNGARQTAWKAGLEAAQAHNIEEGAWVDQESGDRLAPPTCVAVVAQDWSSADLHEAAEVIAVAERSIAALLGRTRHIHELLALEARRYQEGQVPTWLLEATLLAGEPLDEFEGSWPTPDQWEGFETVREQGYSVIFALNGNPATEKATGIEHTYSIDVRDRDGKFLEGYAASGPDAFEVATEVLATIEEAQEAAAATMTPEAPTPAAQPRAPAPVAQLDEART